MLIASFDFETTGLDRNQDRVTEVGVLLYTTSYKRVVMAESFFVDNEMPIPKLVTEKTKITDGMIKKFGLTSADGLSRLQNYFDMSEAILGKNIMEFDVPFYDRWCIQEKEEPIRRQYIDLETDLIDTEPKHLGYMAADAGFLNPFPHAALADAWTALRLFEQNTDKYGLEKVIERAKEPRVCLQAHVTFDTNYQAKERKYRWQPDRKVWYKICKESDVAIEANEAPFNVARIEMIPTH